MNFRMHYTATVYRICNYVIFNQGKHSADILMKNAINGESLIGHDNLFPYIADSLIMTVHRYGKAVYIDPLIKLLYQHMKDPRHPEGQIKWQKVSPRAQAVFLSWLKKNDFEIFLELSKNSRTNLIRRPYVEISAAILGRLSGQYV